MSREKDILLVCPVKERMRLFWRRVRIVPLFALPFLLQGCSDMKFVNAPDVSNDADSREDLWFYKVSADMTSGGLVQRHIAGAAAVYSDTESLLRVGGMELRTFDANKQLQGITSASTATIYLADNTKEKRNKSDMEFLGQVRHRQPMRDNPTSDSMDISMGQLLWDQRTGKFICRTAFDMTMWQSNGSPMKAIGNRFEATRDMRKWTVGSGSMTTEKSAGDLSSRARKLRSDFESSMTQIGDNPPPQAVSRPIEVPDGVPVAEATPQAQLTQQTTQSQQTAQQPRAEVQARPQSIVVPEVSLPTPPPGQVSGGRKVYKSQPYFSIPGPAKKP